MRVEFHTGMDDALGYACRFLRKTQTAQARVVVTGEPPVLDRLNDLLWTFDALSFVAHVRLRQGQGLRTGWERTLTWLADDPTDVPNCPVLVNLGAQMVNAWTSFERVIEIVSSDPDAALAGRRRWRLYGQDPNVERVHHALEGRPT